MSKGNVAKKSKRKLPVSSNDNGFQYPLVRPKKRGDCAEMPRPCPYATCRYSLLVEITDSGRLVDRTNGGDISLIKETCALDIADRGAHTIFDVGDIMGIAKSRAGQISDGALLKLEEEVGAGWLINQPPEAVNLWDEMTDHGNGDDE